MISAKQARALIKSDENIRDAMKLLDFAIENAAKQGEQSLYYDLDRLKLKSGNVTTLRNKLSELGYHVNVLYSQRDGDCLFVSW